MRRLASLCLLIAGLGTAHAHEMTGDASILERLSHELVGLHHLPVTIVLVVAGVVLYRLHSSKASRSK